MSPTFKTLAIAATALLLPAAAQATEEQTFQRDGVSYTYNTVTKNGAQIITGKAGNSPFRLVVRGQRVAGDFNYRPVEFSLRDVKSSAPTVAAAN